MLNENEVQGFIQQHGRQAVIEKLKILALMPDRGGLPEFLVKQINALV